MIITIMEWTWHTFSLQEHLRHLSSPLQDSASSLFLSFISNISPIEPASPNLYGPSFNQPLRERSKISTIKAIPPVVPLNPHMPVRHSYLPYFQLFQTCTCSIRIYLRKPVQIMTTIRSHNLRIKRIPTFRIHDIPW